MSKRTSNANAMRDTLVESGASPGAEVVGYSTGLALDMALREGNVRDAVDAARECRMQLQVAGAEIEAEGESDTLADVLALADSC